MRIAVNTRFLLDGKLEGIGVFTKEVLSRMVVGHPEIEFFFFFDRAYDESFLFADNVVPIVINPPARHPLLWYIWFEWAVPYYLKKYNIDHFFSPDSYLSIKTKVPQTVVIHDLAFEHFPEDVSGIVSKFYSYYLPKYAVKADNVLTVSDFTKLDIVTRYGLDSSEVTVVYNAADIKFQPLALELQDEIRINYTEGVSYYLYVGALHPRKNIERLLLAFDQFKDKSKSETKLLLVGRKAWGNEGIKKTYELMRNKKDVVFTGRVSDQVLPRLYASAKALIYVPYFEGFGMPIVEAQASEIPVITSNKSSMPEVLGGAGILVDPFSVDSIANSMKVLDEDVLLRELLVSKGLENLKRFDWQRTSDIIFDIITKKK